MSTHTVYTLYGLDLSIIMLGAGIISKIDGQKYARFYAQIFMYKSIINANKLEM